ncbi:MAG: phosphatase PAP2 family protein [Candidatus Heimdallarchaeota archaeon]|nr:phosphatase PAP2 family protein [Candidatus Heimdallarchaeota archaeon]MCK5048103.1 phosphatase PAP2 family protein [Candidatus Heimdallarchaeota archaeon]
MIDDQIADFFYDFESSFLDIVFAIITFIGDELFYIMFFSVMFWVYNKELAYEMIYVLLISVSINGSLKEVVKRTRPTFAGEIGKGVVEAEGYSFPSGHSQNSATVWGLWALNLKNRKQQLILASLIILIGFSRIYLVVHFFTDVIAGWIIGFTIAYLIFRAKPRFLEKWHELGINVRISIITVTSLILLGISLLPDASENYSKTISSGAGIIFGIYLGKQLENKYIDFSDKEGLKSFSVFITRILIGVFLVALAYVGLKILFAEIDDGNIILRFIRYFFVGFSVVYLVPYLFTLVERKRNLISKPTEVV